MQNYTHENTSCSESELRSIDAWDDHTPITRQLTITLGCIAIIVLILSLAGNVTVVILFSRYRSLRTSANILVINLTVADLLMSLLHLPLFIISHLYGSWIFGLEGCYVHGFGAALTGFVSILSLAAIAFDRYYSICRRISSGAKISVTLICLMISAIWIFSILGAALPYLGWGRYVFESSKLSCTFDFMTRSLNVRSYNVFLQVFFFGIPFVVIIISYALIYVTVSRHEKKYFTIKKGSDRDNVLLRVRRSRKKLVNHELRIAKLSLIVIFVFCSSWLPYCVVSLIGQFGDQSLITPISSTIPGFLAKMSTVLNAVIYALFNRDFKQKIRTALCVRMGDTNSNTSCHMTELYTTYCKNHRKISTPASNKMYEEDTAVCIL